MYYLLNQQFIIIAFKCTYMYVINTIIPTYLIAIDVLYERVCTLLLLDVLQDQTCIIWDINKMVFVRQLRDHLGPVMKAVINQSNVCIYMYILFVCIMYMYMFYYHMYTFGN